MGSIVPWRPSDTLQDMNPTLSVKLMVSAGIVVCFQQNMFQGILTFTN